MDLSISLISWKSNTIRIMTRFVQFIDANEKAFPRMKVAFMNEQPDEGKKAREFYQLRINGCSLHKRFSIKTRWRIIIANEEKCRSPRLKGATCMTLRGTDKKGGLWDRLSWHHADFSKQPLSLPYTAVFDPPSASFLR